MLKGFTSTSKNSTVMSNKRKRNTESNELFEEALNRCAKGLDNSIGVICKKLGVSSLEAFVNSSTELQFYKALHQCHNHDSSWALKDAFSNMEKAFLAVTSEEALSLARKLRNLMILRNHVRQLEREPDRLVELSDLSNSSPEESETSDSD